jgi:hypothetical protein
MVAHRRMQPVEEPPGLELQKQGLHLAVELVDTLVADLEVRHCWIWGHLGLQMWEAVASGALGEVPSA